MNIILKSFFANLFEFEKPLRESIYFWRASSEIFLILRSPFENLFNFGDPLCKYI